MARHDIQKAIERLLSSRSPLVKKLRGQSPGAQKVPGLLRFEADFLTDYRPHKKQRLLHAAIDRRFVAVVAGRRGGKTYAGGREFLRRVFRDHEQKIGDTPWQAPSFLGDETKGVLEYFVVAPTYKLTAYPKQEIFEVLGGETSPLVLKYNRSSETLWLVGGIKIQFRSGDRPDRLVAAGLDGLWIDEAARLKSDAWDENLRATLSDKRGWALFTTTPLGKNWVYDQIWSHTQLGQGDRFDDFYGLHFTTLDNERVPNLIEEARRAKNELPRAVYLRNYAASFDAFEGKIYEHFLDDETHIVDRIPWANLRRRIGGKDWGFGNPGCLLEAGIDHDGTIWVYREDYQRRLTVPPSPQAPKGDCWVNRMQYAKRRGVESIWADPSEPGHIATCHEYGITEVVGADNAVAPGIEAVAALLMPAGPHKEPAMRIHRGCTNLRRELSSYRWRDDLEKPVKEDDHSCDALRYLAYSEHRMGAGLSRLNFSIFQDVA